VIPKEVSYRETTFTNEREAANLFFMYFSSVFCDNQLNLDTSSLGIKSFDLPNNVNLTVKNVYKHLTDLHDNWSIGPDGLSGEYLYQLKNIIAFPLWTLFKRSLEERIFPSILKFSSVTSIHKSSELSNVSNYRPIFVQSHISKIFEFLVLHCIQPSINKILMEEQHGFHHGRSTITCHLVFNNYVYQYFNLKTQVNTIYTDFNKAFDSVNHNSLSRSSPYLELVNLSCPGFRLTSLAVTNGSNCLE